MAFSPSILPLDPAIFADAAISEETRAFNAMLPDRRWFMRSANGRRTHHLHLVAYGSESWKVHLRFRDVLRSNAALAQRYAELKLQLAAEFGRDREGYTNAKSEFVASVVTVAQPAGRADPLA